MKYNTYLTIFRILGLVGRVLVYVIFTVFVFMLAVNTSPEIATISVIIWIIVTIMIIIQYLQG